MSRFVLTAQLQLQAPTNTAQVVRQIQSQLNNVQVNVQVQGTAQATRQVQQVAQSLNAANSAASNLGRTFAISVKRFTALAVATRAVSLFTNTLASATEEAISFERQLIKISQVTGQSIGELKGLTKTITQLSTGLGVGSQSLLEVSTILLQAGLNSRDTEVALKSLAKAALAPNFDSISETAEGAIAVLAQFKEGVGALENQLSSIDAVAGAFAVEAGDLIDVIRRTGGVFKASGGSLNELLALFTSVRATTRESAESISTGLRTIFTRIQRPKTIEFLKQFGVELVDLEGKFVGPFEAVKRLSESLAGLGERDLTFISIAEELGGFRQIGKVLPLLQQFSTAQAALNVAQKANNGLTKNAETAQQALAIRITKVKEEFLALVRGITETSAFQFFANTTLNLASALIRLADALKPVVPLLTAVATIRAAQGIGSFISGFGGGLGSRRTFNKGGKVHHFARGGMVPGTGNRDTVPAMLSPGEFVIRKSSVNKLGAGNLAAMNENRYASGGIVDQNKIGAAILENVGFDSSNTIKITRKDIENKLPKTLKLSDNYPIKTQKSFTLEREGLSGDTYTVFRNTLRENLVKVAENSAGSLASDLGLVGARTNVPPNDIDKFLRGINDGSMGNLFEDTLKVLSGSPFSTEPQRAFDFENGISNILKDDYKNITSKYVDAKSSLAQSIPSKFQIKAANALAYEAQLNNYVRQESDSEKKQRESFELKAAFGKSAKKKYLGGLIQKFNTGGVAKVKSIKFSNFRDIEKFLRSMWVDGIQKKRLSGERITSSDSWTFKHPLIGSVSLTGRETDELYSYFESQKKSLIRNKGFRTDPTEAILSYKDNSADLNMGLTDKKLSNEQKKEVSTLKKIATDKLPQTLYSGIGASRTSIIQSQVGKNLLQSVGKRFGLPGFLSTSSDIKVAKTFGNGLLLRIATNPSRKGVAADKHVSNEYQHEKEFILPPNSKFRVNKFKRNILDIAQLNKGGGVGTDTVPALLTPGEFVVNKKSAQAIGYGSLNRMNKVGRYANGGVVQRFAAGGAASGNNSGNLFSGVGAQLTLVTASLQALIPPIDENSSGLAKLANNFLSLATTVGGAIFALEAFNIKITKDVIAKGFKSLTTTGKGGLGDIIGGFQKRTGLGGKVVTARRSGESLREGIFNERKKANIDRQILRAREESFQRFDPSTRGQPLFAQQRFDQAQKIRNLRAQKASISDPTSLTGKLGSFLGKKSLSGGIGGRLAGLAARGSTSIGGGAIGGALGGATALAGPLLGIVGAATAVSSAFNSVISSVYDYEKALKTATEKGNVSEAGRIAGQQYDLEAANTTRTSGAVVGATIGAFFGGPIGAAIGAAIGTGLGTLLANAAPGFAETLNVVFGGNTRASVVALAEASAQAAKTTKELADAEKISADAIKEFESGALSASDAMSKIIVATATADTLQRKNETAVKENLQNKSEIGTGAIARNIGSYLGGGYFGGMETADTRNKRIDEENAKLIESQRASVVQASRIKMQAGITTARPGIIASLAAGKSTEEIKKSAASTTGGLNDTRSEISKLRIKAADADLRGDKKTGTAFRDQAAELETIAKEYEKSINNLIKEQGRLLKTLQALNLGLRGPASTAAAAASQLQYFAAQIEGNTLPAINALSLLESSVSSAGVALDTKSLKQATKDVADTLTTLGASESSINKFTRTTEALNSVQTRYSSVAAEIAAEQKKSGSSASPQDVLKKFAEKLGAGMPKEIQDLIKGIELTDSIKDQIAAGDYSGIGEAIGEQGQKLLAPVIKIIEDYQKANQVLIELTKKRIDAERNYIASVKEAQDLMIEGREVQAKYGGAPVTQKERLGSILAKANASNSLTGLSNMASGNVGDIRARNKQISQTYAANQAKISSGTGAGTASGENLKQQQQELKNAQKDQVQTIRELIKLEEENLKLISEKNKLEKDSVDALVSGDIEKFFEQQAAAGAQAAVASGSVELQRAYGSRALGAAAQETRRQQEAGVESLYGRRLSGAGGLTEAAYGAATSSMGIQDQRLAQIAAGTTPEEEASKARLRGLGGALAETGSIGVDMANMDLKEAKMNVEKAEIILQETITRGKEAGALGDKQVGEAVGLKNGGIVYANRGIFVPRGTDIVPAMLTPGEFVVRREAVQRGNNLQLLQAMNRGNSNGDSSINGSVGMANGGMVRYRANGSSGPESGGGSFGISPEVINNLVTSLTQFNKDLTSNIEKLDSTNFNIKLDTTNINVNLTGTSFLGKLKEDLQSELYTFVGQEIQNYGIDNGGKLKRKPGPK